MEISTILCILTTLVVLVYNLYVAIYNYKVCNRNLGSNRKQAKRPKSNRELERQLMILVRNDRKAANRLMSYAQKRYPGKSQQWYLEKVIWDIERDRH